MIVIDTSRNQWRALVEAKIGTADLKYEQIKEYVELAKKNDIDSLITISNQFTAYPDHHPVDGVNQLGGKIKIYHFSWMRLITIATLLISSSGSDFDENQLCILKEMLRFFSHQNIDVRSFHSMTSHWQPLISGIKAGREFRANDIEVVETIKSWHQEQQDICLILCRNLGVSVQLVIPRKFRDDHLARVESDAETLADNRIMTASFAIPNAAGQLDVTADVGSRTIRCGMLLDAPGDKKSFDGRLNWLLQQLPDQMPDHTYIKMIARNTTPKMVPVAEVMDDPANGKFDNPTVVPTVFEISVVTDLAGQFSGRTKFIDALEDAVPAFYDRIAKHVKKWRPLPPPGPADRGEESLEQSVDRITGSRQVSEKVVKRGTISGRRFAIFEDGSIEVETRDGLKWFKDLGSLQKFMDVPI